jgi:hypothetical protein
MALADSEDQDLQFNLPLPQHLFLPHLLQFRSTNQQAQQ